MGWFLREATSSTLALDAISEFTRNYLNSPRYRWPSFVLSDFWNSE
jgi:hypothetical protein